MQKNIFTIKGTAVPTLIGLLVLLWAAGFTGVMYLLYETEVNAYPVAFQTIFTDVV